VGVALEDLLCRHRMALGLDQTRSDSEMTTGGSGPPSRICWSCDDAGIILQNVGLRVDLSIFEGLKHKMTAMYVPPTSHIAILLVQISCYNHVL
jgi:hypothetical protein